MKTTTESPFAETARTYRYTFQEPPNIIHRSTNRIIVATDVSAEPQVEDKIPRGWKSP